jgi:hypothetical protein
VGRELTGEAVVSGPSGEEAKRLLDEAEERTRASRERAREELGDAGGDRAPSGQGGDRKAR